jgi:hypothetical protein
MRSRIHTYERERLDYSGFNMVFSMHSRLIKVENNKLFLCLCEKRKFA